MQELKIRLLRYTGGLQVVVFPNGVFEMHNLSASEKDFLTNIFQRLNFIEDVNFSKASKINFGKWKFNNGFAQPADLFNVKGQFKIDQNLEENVEIHTELNPKIWDENNELLEDIEKKIYIIVDEFKKQLEKDEVKLDIVDIYILGSNANYNYTDTSDLDVHIIANETFDCDEKHLPLIYNAYKSLFNLKYDISINGINVELYVENIDDFQNKSTAIYSLKKGWIKEPSQESIPKIDEEKLEKLIAEWENKYLKLIAFPTVEGIEDYINTLYDERRKSIKTDGEFGLGNLMFKEMRRLKYLENLKKLRTNLKNKELSLE